MIIEGRNAINEALKGNTTIEKVLVQNEHNPSLNRLLSECNRKKIKLSNVDKSVLDKYSSGKNHQGIIAFTTDFEYSSFEEVVNNNKQEYKLIIILDGIEDPHNLGSIIRIADSVNANGIIIPRHRSCGVTDTAVKVSSGASAYVKIAKVGNINDTIKTLKEKGIWVYATDMEGESVYDCELSDRDLAVIIGGEGKGVHAVTKRNSDKVIGLPQMGKINSLNAAVATGAILYECIRQRINKK